MTTWAFAQILALVAFLFWTGILVEIETQTAREHAFRDVPAAPAEGAPTAADPAAGPARADAQEETRSRNWIEQLADRIKTAGEKVAPADPTQRPNGLGEWIRGYERFIVELAQAFPPWVFPLVWIVKIASFVVYLVQIPITYAVRRLDYELRWYMVTDRSLRLRHGVWKVSESTMSFANIQQVVVTRGPLQHLLGLADVRVQSAGGGNKGREHQQGAQDDMHVGMFRHVTNATEIRDLILERLRRFRETGLGDPEDHVTVAETPPVVETAGNAIVAARELLAETRALRAQLR